MSDERNNPDPKQNLLICTICYRAYPTALDLVRHLLGYHGLDEATAVRLTEAALSEAKLFPADLDCEAA